MANLVVEGDDLVLQLTTVEKLEAVHSDIRVSRHSVGSIEVCSTTPSGLCTAGASAPAFLESSSGPSPPGTRRRSRSFHHDTPRGVFVRLVDFPHGELVGCSDPEAVVAALTRPGS